MIQPNLFQEVPDEGGKDPAAVQEYQWRMLFPIPMPPISNDPRHPAQMATVDIKCPQRQ